MWWCALQLFHNSCTAWVCRVLPKKAAAHWDIDAHIASHFFAISSKCNNLEAVKMLAKWKPWLVYERTSVATNAQPHFQDVYLARDERAHRAHTLSHRRTHTGQCNNSSRARTMQYSKSFFYRFLCLRCHIATQGPYIIWVKRKIWSTRKEIRPCIWCIWCNIEWKRRRSWRRIRKRQEKEISEKKTDKNNSRKYCYHKA